MAAPSQVMIRKTCLHTTVRQVSACHRNFLPALNIHHYRSNATVATSWTDRLPIIIRPSFWRSLVPKPFRRKDREERMKNRPRQQEWNPATYFILIFLLIGSNGIHFVNLRHKYAISSRQADGKIALLQEVLRKVQNGEDVDVEKVLGTGDPLAEQEWQEVLRHIEEEDRLWQSEEKRKKKERLDQEYWRLLENSSTRKADEWRKAEGSDQDGENAPRPKRKPGFY